MSKTWQSIFIIALMLFLSACGGNDNNDNNNQNNDQQEQQKQDNNDNNEADIEPPRWGSGYSHYSNEPLRGRKLWRYGDWGNAGEHIGRHWEDVATPILRAAIGYPRPPVDPDDPAYTPRMLISIVADPDLAARCTVEPGPCR